MQSLANCPYTADELQNTYARRFRGLTEYRQSVWRILTREFFSRYITADGAVLVFNAHLSSRSDQAIEFPDAEASLPDEYSRRLFRMSSCLPLVMIQSARQAGFSVGPQTRGFVFNADLASVVRFLDIGTRVDLKNLR